jgi:hypothetical protein
MPVSMVNTAHRLPAGGLSLAACSSSVSSFSAGQVLQVNERTAGQFRLADRETANAEKHSHASLLAGSDEEQPWMNTWERNLHVCGEPSGVSRRLTG